ncbi:MAG TPA: hypothetical protein VKP88_00490 [Candidatus Paceibacterota bacterium]|nr:hypothetical protein [Candidatus Paceibacterota bacterium]
MADLTSQVVEFSRDTVFSPEAGIPLPTKETYMDVRARAEAACRTMVSLRNFDPIDFGQLDFDDEDVEQISSVVEQYAEDPEKANKQITSAEFSKLSSTSVVLVNNVLQEYSASVVEDAQKIRNLITNKLLLETEHDDARIRLKALELLGKISDVGLFSEKSEVTIKHQDTSALRAKLVERLERLTGVSRTQDAVNVEEGEVIENEAD